jgi:nicotinamide-nucleotide amidase
MRATILSIGDELTAGQERESNAAWLAGQLAARAITTLELRVVPDDRTAIAGAIRDMAVRCDLLLATGGIGPTADDLTRQGLSAVVSPGRALETDVAALAALERRWRSRAGRMPPANSVQAQHPFGTRLVPNPHGTAPGIAGELGDCTIFVMPGPPKEMRKMFRDHVVPILEVRAGVVSLTGRVHEFGLGESAAEERLGALTDRGHRPLVGLTHSGTVVTARIRAQGPAQEVARQIEEIRSRIIEAWAPYAYGTDDQTLAGAVAALLRERGRTLVTAESCTGGLLGKLIVDEPGASDFYAGGWVAYTDRLKTTCLAVEPDILHQHGAVSEQTARAMAAGALDCSGADESLAVTGVAGPAGGSDAKPVGTVYIGLARREAEVIKVCRFRFPGDRTAVRDRAASSALQMLRFALLGVEPPAPLLWTVQ